MDRLIRRLRLGCAREEDARHGRVLLEDAMRTATLGDEARLVIVRRLDLGRISPKATATQWSWRLEESFRKAQAHPVRFDTLGAVDAPAVWFPTRHEPWLQLAERVATGRTCPEWYWPPALPQWRSGMAVPETLRLCHRTLGATGGLRLTLMLAARLHARGALVSLLRALVPGDFELLRSDLGPFRASTPTPRNETAISVPTSALEAGFVAAWGTDDIRTRWLARVLLERQAGITPSHTPTAPMAPAVIEQVLLQWTSTQRNNHPVFSRKSKTPRMDVAPESRSAKATHGPDRAYTAAGGLFFMLPLLVQSGFLPFLATRSDAERALLPWQIVQLALRHCRVAPTDPLRVTLEALPAPKVKIGRWLLAANRHSLRAAGMNLRKLILRPAHITLTPTHVDVFFRSTDADIRMRRAGLDIDPGWVPWLARVVAFHFSRED